MTSTPNDTRTPAPRRYGIAGTGGRAQMYLGALLTTHADLGSVVAFIDTNTVRMDYYDTFASDLGSTDPIAHYSADQVEQFFTESRVEVLIITSPDFTHARYIIAALERGVDVICEKPMTTDLASIEAIEAAAAASTASLVVTFNYRYSPRNSEVRRLIQDGEIGDVTSVHFEWCLDTVHGADYFRRWHRDKANSGGLLVHKSTHHFDLVNWWIADVPASVYALGGLRFYGRDNADRRGLGERGELGRDIVGTGDPFALDLSADPKLDGLFLQGEKADGYLRDRDVFSAGITIEDNLTLAVGYSAGASMAYTLNAHSPWEGYRVAINGTRGRIELEVVERAAVTPSSATSGLGAKGKDAPLLDPSAVDDLAATESVRPHGSRIILQKHWETPVEIEIPTGAGAHGGGDAMLLDDVFRGPGIDPLHRQAGYRDGVSSIIVGIAGNLSLESRTAVNIADFGLQLTTSSQAAAVSA